MTRWEQKNRIRIIINFHKIDHEHNYAASFMSKARSHADSIKSFYLFFVSRWGSLTFVDFDTETVFEKITNNRSGFYLKCTTWSISHWKATTINTILLSRRHWMFRNTVDSWSESQWENLFLLSSIHKLIMNRCRWCIKLCNKTNSAIRWNANLQLVLFYYQFWCLRRSVICSF